MEVRSAEQFLIQNRRRSVNMRERERRGRENGGLGIGLAKRLFRKKESRIHGENTVTRTTVTCHNCSFKGKLH